MQANNPIARPFNMDINKLSARLYECSLYHYPDYDPCWSLCGLHTRYSTDVENLSFNRTGAMRSSAFGSLFHPRITKMASKERSSKEVYEDEPVLQAFKMMRLKGIGGIPVVGRHGRKAVGNISIRDVQFLLIAPEIYKDYRSITAKDFLVTARRYREEHDEELPSHSIVTCKRDVTLKEAILTLDSKKIHRIYLVDDDGDLQGVITLRDIISRLVRETRGYLGDFFDGFSPNTRG
ncbi:hypothetical protein Nepgr_033323 [Nepenthes gracilis]|uniref:CBS domain-containing protein n=1 Tax=Nepenthes gracilis TaxID=150966 RepID=A0AAD3TL02_NEPGR|nr:hypothetical protein Nepgr_033323 [Nepenthes gracilis]